MNTQQEKKKGTVMLKYEKRKLRILAFIAAVLFVWAAVSVGTIIDHFHTQAIIEDTQPPRTTNKEIVETLIEIVNRLERLENR